MSASDAVARGNQSGDLLRHRPAEHEDGDRDAGLARADPPGVSETMAAAGAVLEAFAAGTLEVDVQPAEAPADPVGPEPAAEPEVTVCAPGRAPAPAPAPA